MKEIWIIPQARLTNEQLLSLTPAETWAYFAPFMHLDLGPLIAPNIRDSDQTRNLGPAPSPAKP